MENRKLLMLPLCLMIFFLFIGAASGEEDKLSLLLNQLDSPDSNVRIQAISSIGSMGDKRAVEPLIKRLGIEKESRVQDGIIRVLGQLKDARAFDAILIAYKKEGRNNPTLGGTVADSISQLKDPRVVPELINIFEGYPSYFTKERTARVLGELKDKRAVPVLIAALEKIDPYDTSASVDAIVWALGEIGDTTAVPALIKALDRKDLLVDGVALALGKIGDRRAIPSLENAYKKERLYLIKVALKMLTGKDY